MNKKSQTNGHKQHFIQFGLKSGVLFALVLMLALQFTLPVFAESPSESATGTTSSVLPPQETDGENSEESPSQAPGSSSTGSESAMPEESENSEDDSLYNIRDVFIMLALSGNPAYAQDDSHTILSSMQATFLAPDGTALPSPSPGANSTVLLTLKVKISPDVLPFTKPGSYYTFALPTALIFAGQQTYLNNNPTLGQVTVGTAGAATITLGDAFGTASPVPPDVDFIASFTLEANFNSAVYSPEGAYQIAIPDEPQLTPLEGAFSSENDAPALGGGITPFALPVGTDIKTYFAGGATPSIVTGMNIVYTDPQGNPLPPGTANIDSQLNFTLDLAIPDDVTAQIKAGDYYNIQLPNSVAIKTGLYNQPLTDANGVVYGRFSVDTNGLITIVFTNAIHSLTNVTGQLNFSGNFDASNVTDPGNITINIPGESNVSAGVTLKPKVGSTIEKQGAFDKVNNPDSITWRVFINKAMNTLTDATVDETFPSGLDLGSMAIAVYPATVDLNGKVTNVDTGAPLALGTDYTIGPAPTYTVTFLHNISTPYCIQYTTPIDPSVGAGFGGTVAFPNIATLNWQGNTSGPISAQASLTTNYNATLKKSYTNYVGPQQKISWLIQYNYQQQNIFAASALVSDTYDSMLDFDASSLHVYPVTFDANGNPTRGAELQPSTDYVLTNTPASNNFTIQFSANSGSYFSRAVDIVYDTTANQEVLIDTNVHNHVETGGLNPPSSNTNITLRQQGVTKSVVGVNYGSPVGGKTITWKLVINADRKEMHQFFLNDFLNVPISGNITNFSVHDDTANSTLTDVTDYQLTPVLAGFQLTLTAAPLANPVPFTDHQYTIVYSTPILGPPTNPTDNYYTNHARIEWTDGVNPSSSDSNLAQVQLNTQTQNNGMKNGTYNAVTKQITWNVYTNYAEAGTLNAYISDPIPTGQAYVPGSAKIFFYSVNPNGTTNQLRELTADEYSHFNIIPPSTGNPELVVNLPDSLPGAINGVPLSTTAEAPLFLIQFQTSVEGTMVKNQYTNTASFYNDYAPTESLTGSVSVTNGGQLAQKNGTQGADGYAWWDITINPSQSTMTTVKVVDTPSANQSVVMNSLTITGMQVATNGALTPDAGNVLTLGTDYTATYAQIAGVWTLTIEFIGSYSTINKAYYLSYKASIYVDPQNGSITQQITNSATITGVNQTQQNQTVTRPIQVNVNRGGGTIRGTLLTMQISKTNADGSQLLPGAGFQLYDQNGNPVGGVTYTDSSGTITYTNIVSGNYTIQEVVAPAGYVISDILAAGVPVTLDAANNSFTFKNGPSHLLFYKENEQGMPVADAVFTLEEWDGSGWQVLQSNLTTDSGGQIMIDTLAAGRYRFLETATQSPYVLNTEPFVFDFTPASSTVVVGPFVNYTASITLQKQDEAGQPLAGAQFELANTNGQTPAVTLTSDAQGLVSYTGLAAGTYTLREIVAPTGYTLSTQQITFTVNAQYTGKPAMIDLGVFVNEPTPVTPTSPSTPSTPATPTTPGGGAPSTADENGLYMWILLASASILALAVGGGAMLIQRRKNNAKVQSHTHNNTHN